MVKIDEKEKLMIKMDELETLKIEHIDLDHKIKREYALHAPSPILQDLKKRKLKMKDKIEKLIADRIRNK